MEIKQFTPKDHYLKVLIYGPSGVGKTTLAGTALKPLFLSSENGLLSIREKKPEYVKIRSLDDIREAFVYLSKGDHPYQTVVIDSITELNDIIKLNMEKRLNRQMGIPEWTELAKVVEGLLRGFVELKMDVVFLAHELIEYDDKGKVIRIVPAMNGKLATKIAAYMDTVAYMQVNDHGVRKITVDSQPNLITKDRTKFITNDLQDLAEWKNRLQALEIGEETTVVDQKIELPSEESNLEATPQQSNPTPPPATNTTDVGNHKTPEEIKKFLLSELWKKIKEKGGDRAQELFKRWMSYKYNTETSATLTVDQLNEMIGKIDSLVAKLFIEFVDNIDKREPAEKTS